MAITYFERPLNHEVYSLESGLAIVQNGDTASVAITSGQYIFLKNHSTLPNGGYHATANIASGTTISSSNVFADENGIINKLATTINNDLGNKVNKSAIANNLKTTDSGYVLDARQGKALNDKINTKTVYTGTANSTNVSSLEGFVVKTANAVSGYLIFTSKVSTSSNVTLITGLPGTYNGYVQLPCISLSGTNQYRCSRVRITLNGEITMWYGLSLESGIPYLIPVNYVCA